MRMSGVRGQSDGSRRLIGRDLPDPIIQETSPPPIEACSNQARGGRPVRSFSVEPIHRGGRKEHEPPLGPPRKLLAVADRAPLATEQLAVQVVALVGRRPVGWGLASTFAFHTRRWWTVLRC